MTGATRALKWTVESMAADYNYIDVLTFYRRGLRNSMFIVANIAKLPELLRKD